MPAELQQLDWQAFSARYFPDGQRHDFGVVKAYEAYRNGSPMEEPSRPGTRPRRRGQERAVEVWEGEGGAITAAVRTNAGAALRPAQPAQVPPG
jgi:hypothetical protein